MWSTEIFQLAYTARKSRLPLRAQMTPATLVEIILWLRKNCGMRPDQHRHAYHGWLRAGREMRAEKLS